MVNREKQILEIIKEFYDNLPKFPDGRIDYSNSNIAPVVIVFIQYKKKLLLLKRSEKGLNYNGKWSVVAGFLDEVRSVQDKVIEEVQEEVGIQKDDILSIHIGKPYHFEDEEIGKTWVKCPVLIKLKSQIHPRLDWEHDEYRWIEEEELREFDIVPSIEKSLDYALK
ncbi:MAG: NUDIX domain-containing protein [Patescibacteria group bacterium]